MNDPDHARHLYQRWMEMWNGDLDAAGEIFAGDCVAHPAPTTTGEPPIYRGPDQMRLLVEMGRAIFGEGTYGGGMPGATAKPGTPITFGGIDVWRLKDGKVVEYWVASDGLHLMAQLEVGGQA